MRQVLLIDDDPLQLRVRETLFRTAGFPVTIATSAEVAMGALRSPSLGPSVGVVITDHLLPGASGSEFAGWLRREGLELPAIVLSGMAEAEGEYEGLDVIFLTKPCPPAELLGLVRRLLREAA